MSPDLSPDAVRETVETLRAARAKTPASGAATRRLKIYCDGRSADVSHTEHHPRRIVARLLVTGAAIEPESAYTHVLQSDIRQPSTGVSYASTEVPDGMGRRRWNLVCKQRGCSLHLQSRSADLLVANFDYVHRLFKEDVAAGSGRDLDRLIMSLVAFGKTSVALRALQLASKYAS